MRAWTVGTIAIVLYLFVVHSYKLNLGTVAIGMGLFGVVLHERPIRFTPVLYWYGAFLAWNLVLVPASVNPSVSIDAWTNSAKILLITFLTLNSIRNPKQHRLITLAWLAMFAFFPVRGTLFNFVGGNSIAGRYAWNMQFSNFNDMAALTLIPLAMSVERLRSTEKKWVKACALCGLFILPFIILITQSRGGMLGLAAVMLYLLGRSRFKLRMIGAAVPIGLIALLFAPQAVWDRIQGMSYLTSVETLGQSDSSAEQRYVIWQVAQAIIGDNVVTGVGIGAYPIAHQRYATTRSEWSNAGGARDTHSAYLNVWAESGLIGLGLFLMIFISGFRELMTTVRSLKQSVVPLDRELRDRCQAYQAALVGLAICAVFASLQVIVFPYLLLALAAAAVRNRAPAGAMPAA